MYKFELALAIALLVSLKNVLAQKGLCTPSYCLLGDCENVGEGPICHCIEGFKGTRCESALLNTDNPCLSNPCWNKGVCSQNGGDYTCSCSVGYTGKNCRTAINNYCDRNKPCKTNGYCELISTSGQFVCNCYDFWEGNLCQIEVPLCQRPTNPCLNNGVCENNKCVCPTNFIGDMCQTYSPAPRTVKVLNKGGYIADLRLSYELPVTTVNGQSGYETVTLKKSISLGRTATFQIPFNVNLESANGAKLYAKAIGGRVIFHERILTDPKCFHVWGTTLTTRWSSMPCW